MNAEIDIRHILSTIRGPDLDPPLPARPCDQLWRKADTWQIGFHGRSWSNCRGSIISVGSVTRNTVLGEIEEFLTGVRHSLEPDRVLATVLFTDIVGATERAAALGDRRWHDLLDSHHKFVRRELARFRGREIKHGRRTDSLLHSMVPPRAIRCACAISEGVQPLGLNVRAGLHTGECEVMGSEIGGIVVHTGAAGSRRSPAPGEVLVSSTVKDLVAGSGLRFSEYGIKISERGPWRMAPLFRRATITVDVSAGQQWGKAPRKISDVSRWPLPAPDVHDRPDKTKRLRN